ncbi:phytanoyl-CoA dioxygenase family protein [Nocardiopsis coralliicola]
MTPTLSEGLHTAHPLPDGAPEAFARDGFAHVRGALDPADLAAVEGDITDAVLSRDPRTADPAARDTLQRAFIQVGNVWRFSQGARDLVFSQRLARIAAELMGSSAVRLYFDQALYKPPGGAITPWHADQYYWPLAGDGVCTAWIPLQDTPLEMGPLSFARGSHTRAFGRDLPISEDSERALSEDLERAGLPTVQEPYALGDVSFHLGWTFHRAGPNESDVPRRVQTVVFLDADLKVADAIAEHERAQRDILMPGTEPGTVPDGPANPLLYPL